jgi:hypothetical protein
MSDLSGITLYDFPVVAHVEDSHRVVINRGSDAGIKKGQRFLIFGIGKEIFDPATKKSLGTLELVRGTGKVAHVQPQMAVIESDMTVAGGKTVTRPDPSQRRGLGTVIVPWLNPLQEPYITEKQEAPTVIGFEDPAVGDFAKQI